MAGLLNAICLAPLRYDIKRHTPYRWIWPSWTAGCLSCPRRWYLHSENSILVVLGVLCALHILRSITRIIVHVRTNFTVPVVFLNGVVFGEANPSHPFDAFRRGQRCHLRETKTTVKHFAPNSVATQNPQNSIRGTELKWTRQEEKTKLCSARGSTVARWRVCGEFQQ